MLYSLYLSFTNWDLISNSGQYVGFRNYVRMFTIDPAFWRSVQHHRHVRGGGHPAQAVRRARRRAAAGPPAPGHRRRPALFYLPSLLGGSVALALVWQSMFSRTGAVNDALGHGRHRGQAVGQRPQYVLYTIVLLGVWQFGAPMVIFLAGLKQIPVELYEAAAVDGASRWRQFLQHHAAVAVAGHLLQPGAGDHPQLPDLHLRLRHRRWPGRPVDATKVYTLLLYLEGFGESHIGYASALAWVFLCAVGLLTLVFFRTGRFWVHYATTRSADGHAGPGPGPAPLLSARGAPRRTAFVLACSPWCCTRSCGCWPRRSRRPARSRRTCRSCRTSRPWQNYVRGWTGMETVSFARFFLNSTVIATGVVIANCASCLVTAYAFARLRFPLRGMWFSVMIATLLLPHHVLIVPQFVLFKFLGWIDTPLPLIAPRRWPTEAFFVFLMVQFMRGIPRELDEAAKMDGCSPFGIFGHVILPLARPAIVTTAIFSFIWTWNDFFSQLIYLNSPDNYTCRSGCACSSAARARPSSGRCSPCRCSRWCRCSCSSSPSSGCWSRASTPQDSRDEASRG
jgi:ABC-type glycerol-3-phosphate transport system permease component